jgi:hypothetical protein
MTVVVAAVKKSKHGAYGRRLALVTLSGEQYTPQNERTIHEDALVELRKELPGLKITTEVVEFLELRSQVSR